MPRLTLAALLGLSLLPAGPTRGEPLIERRSVSLQDKARALACLRKALVEESRWIKVHAAEFLLALGEPQGVRQAFEAELERNAATPMYRIGIWRVLALASPPGERDRWSAKTRAAAEDPDGEDRIHAIESLAKLRVQADDALLRAAAQVEADEPACAPFVEWLRLNSSTRRDYSRLVRLLDSGDSLTRLRTAYVIRSLHPDDWPDRDDLARRAEREAAEGSSRAFLLAAAWVLASEARAPALRTAMLQLADRGETIDRLQAAAALAERGTIDDVPRLLGWLADDDADVGVSAAAAILCIALRYEQAP